MKSGKNKRCKGLTLIESIVSVSTIAVMFAVSIPSLEANKEVTRRAVCANNLKSQGQGIFIYAGSHNQTLPPSSYRTGDRDWSDGTFGTPYLTYLLFTLKADATLSMPPKDRVDGVYGLGYLWYYDIITEGEVFYCPSSPEPVDNTGAYSISFRYDYYSMNGSTFPWNNGINDPTSAYNEINVRSSYNYVPQAFGTETRISDFSGVGDFPETATKVSQLHASQVMVCDLIYNMVYLSHKEGSNEPGLNGLFGDGSVRFKNDPEILATEFWGDVPYPGSDEYVFRTIISLLENDS